MKFREVFDRFGDRVKEVLGKMSATQRLSIGLLAGVIVLSFVILILLNISGTGGKWEKLFYSPLQPAQQEYALRKLGTTEFKIEDGTIILVRSEERPRIAAMFMEDPVVYGEQDFFAGLFEPSFIETDSQRDMKFTNAREKQLSAYIGHFKGIRRAYVVINRGDNTIYMSSEHRKPTAAVSVELSPGTPELPRETVTAISRTVAASIKDLKPEDVSIADFNGNYYHVPSIDDNQVDSDNRLKVLKSVTAFFDERILQLFGHIPGFKVATYVKIDWKSVKERILTVPTAEELPAKRTTETRTGGSSETGGPVGVDANMGGVGLPGNVSGAGGTTGGTSEKKTTIEPLTDKVSEMEKLITTSPGEFADITVTVSIPFNYLATPLDGSPIPSDTAVRDKTVQDNIANIKQQIKGPTGISDEQKIIVAAKQAMAPPEVPTVSMGQQIWSFTEPLVGKVLIAVFALAALFLVATFIKKNIPRPQQIPIEEIEEKIEKEVAKEKKDFLAELEKMDESEMKAVQVKERVQEMVGENPESAATLLKTWIYKED